MAGIFDNVIDLNPMKTTWKIKVKIIRLWRQYFARDIESIEMVLLDSNVSCFGIPVLYVHCYYANFIAIYWYLYGFNDTHDRGIRFKQLLMRMWFRSLNLSSKKVIRRYSSIFRFLKHVAPID